MRKTLITLGLCFVFSAFTFAQATEAGTGPRLEVDQYGQQVETFPIEVTMRNGVTWFENRERGYRFWFDGRVQIDFANHHNQRNGTLIGPDGTTANFVYRHASGPLQGQIMLDDDGNRIVPEATPHMPGGMTLRRVRFAVKAELTDQWYAEIDFNMINGRFGLQDAYIQFTPRALPSWMFRVGNFKEDFSMEYTTSSRFVTMMERPMNITAFNFTRRLGIQTKWQDMERSPWLRASGGITFQEIDGFTLAHNVNAVQREEARGSGPNFTGKVVFMPWATEVNRGLHFGYNIQHRSGRWVSDDAATIDEHDSRAWHGMRVNSRNAHHVNRTQYLDTRWFRNGVRGNLFQGVEVAGFWNGWRFGSEFIWHDMIMDRDLAMFPTFTNADGSPNTTVHARGAYHGFRELTPGELVDIYARNKRHWGFYAYVGKILFGGQQRYDIRQSEFTRPTRGRSWGDIEVLFRYDYVNLNNQFRDLPVQVLVANGGGGGTAGNTFGQPGGAGHNFTFGVNYWINSNMRFTINYTISHNDVWANGGGHLNAGGRRNIAVGRDANGNFTGDPLSVASDGGVSFNTLQMRLEIAF